MPWGDWINELPMGFFMAVHIAAFAIGAIFAWQAHVRGLSLLTWAFALFALAEVSYMTYHLDWTVFLFAHTISEVLDLVAFILVLRGRGRPRHRPETGAARGRGRDALRPRALRRARRHGGGLRRERPARVGAGRHDRVELPQSYRFDPPVIEVELGAEVTWENGDNFTDTIRFDGEDETAELEPGDSYAREFPEEGSFHYVCTLHPRDMEGEVRVGQ